MSDSSAFGFGKFGCNFIRQPGLHIKCRIIQHRLRRGRIGIKVAKARHDFIERCGLPFQNFFADIFLTTKDRQKTGDT